MSVLLRILGIHLRQLQKSREALLLMNLQLAINARLGLEQRVEERTQALQYTLQELRRNLKFKDHLYAVLAHELRSPFASLEMIMGLLEADLQHGDVVAQTLPKLRQRVKGVQDSVNQLLEWLQAENSSESQDIQVLPVTPFLQEVWKTFVSQAEQKGIRMRITAQVEQRIAVQSHHLHLILCNLVHNAIKFSPSGAEITLAATCPDSDTVCISVTDTGMGMDADQIAAIFAEQPLVSRLGTFGEKGFGLGLQLCLAYLRTNQAELRVHSQPGVGTTMELIFKAKREEPSDSLPES